MLLATQKVKQKNRLAQIVNQHKEITDSHHLYSQILIKKGSFIKAPYAFYSFPTYSLTPPWSDLIVLSVFADV